MLKGLEPSYEKSSQSWRDLHSPAWCSVRRFPSLPISLILICYKRATAASIARLVIYIEILHATEAGVELDTNRKIRPSIFTYLAY